MRKTLTLLIVLVFALSSSGWLFSQQNAEDEKFQKTVDNYLDAFWKFYPTAGTMAGYHKYDNKLEDFSTRSLERRHDELDELNQELVAKVDMTKLSTEVHIDHEIIVEALDMELIRHEAVVPWAYNPLFYNDIIENCIRSILTSTTGSPEDRAKNAAERLKELPKLLKQAQENLQAPPQIYTETAIRQFEFILDFYQNQLPQIVAQAPDSERGKLQENLTKALPELQNYQSYLQNDLLSKSTGNFRLGAAHNRMLRLLLQNDIPIQELISRANADIENIRREMTLICTPYYKIMDPRFDLNNPPGNLTTDQLMNELVFHVMARFKDDHLTREGFSQGMQDLTAGIRTYIEENQLIDIPDRPVTIVMAPHRGYTWTRFIRPNVYEPSDEYTIEVGLIVPDIDDATALAILEEYNNYLLPFFIMRQVFPGQFVPVYFADQNTPSMVRKLYPNQPLIKGWPILVEEMMILSGYGNYDLRLRLAQLKLRMKAAIDFILELNIHQAGMTEEQAMGYMQRKGFLSEIEAKYNWDRIRLLPGDATYAYVGLQELLDMQEAYKNKVGDSFSQKEFLSKVLSYGNLPLRRIKRLITE
ncbi:MAG: DUF885 family protein [Candidatus Aminicenantaceae bacterium]